MNILIIAELHLSLKLPAICSYSRLDLKKNILCGTRDSFKIRMANAWNAVFFVECPRAQPVNQRSPPTIPTDRSAQI